METEKRDEFTKIFYKYVLLIIIIIELFFNKNTSVYFKLFYFMEKSVPEHLPDEFFF